MTPRRRAALFAGYSVVVGVLNSRVLLAMLERSRSDAAASHIVLVPVITLALIYQARQEVFRRMDSAWLLGLSILALSVGFRLTSSVAVLGPGDSLSLSSAGLVLAIVGGFVAVYGTVAARAASFPLLFLCFAIPPPDFLLETATVVLKRGSTEVVSGLFRLADIAHYREGFVFVLPGLVIEIADECSGIRSSTALVLSCLLAGHMFLHSTWRKGLLVLAVFPVTLLKNGIRIAALSLLAIKVDPSFMTGQLHREGGVAFFALALLLLSPLMVYLRSSELGLDRREARSAAQVATLAAAASTTPRDLT
jgi:exosortase